MAPNRYRRDMTSTTMQTTTESALSDLVLRAARAAMPIDPAQHFADPTPFRQLGPKNCPMVPLLMAQLDACEQTAQAIADNCWDDSLPLDRRMAEDMANQCYRLGAVIQNATQCPAAAGWSLPSCTGKELI